MLPVQRTNLKHSPLLFASSGFLYLYPALLLLLPASCAKRLRRRCWPHYLTQTFTFTSTVAAIITSIIIKYTRHYKYFITAGAAIYLLGIVS